MSEDTSARPFGFERRAILKGAAWSVPMIAVAVGSPAFAVSGPTITFDSITVFLEHREDPILLDGHLTGTAGTRPAVVSMTYTAGFIGDSTAIVDPETGNFRATAYADVGPSTGTAAASAPEYASASVGMHVEGA